MPKKPMKRQEKFEDPLDLILSGEQIKETVKTRRGSFVLAFPLPKDLRKIEQTLSDMLDGRLIASFTQQAIENMRCYAALSVVVIDAPEWWDKLKTPEDCPDDKLITLLYRRYLQLYSKTQALLSRGVYRKRTSNDEEQDSETETVDSGAFSGITN